MGIVAQFSGVVKFLAYFISALLLTATFLIVYMRITPYKEFDLIDNGNTAAACSLSGALLGFIIPLASAIIHSVNFFDMLVWGAVALGIQILVYLLVKQLFKRLPSAIEEGIVSKGLFLGALSLAAGILNAACMSY
jgi:putative membrane protein